MKRLVLISASLLLPLSQALAGEWVVSGTLGMALGDTNASQLDKQLKAQGLTANASSNDDNRSAWQLSLGYDYAPNWGVEFGYVDLGQIETTFSGTTVDINSFLTSVSDIHPQTAQGWRMGGVFRQHIAEKSWLLLRGGVLHWRSDYTLSTTSVSRKVKASGVGNTVGLGVEVEVMANTRAGVDYNHYDIDGESISVYSAGVSYRFD